MAVEWRRTNLLHDNYTIFLRLPHTNFMIFNRTSFLHLNRTNITLRITLVSRVPAPCLPSRYKSRDRSIVALERLKAILSPM